MPLLFRCTRSSSSAIGADSNNGRFARGRYGTNEPNGRHPQSCLAPLALLALHTLLLFFTAPLWPVCYRGIIPPVCQGFFDLPFSLVTKKRVSWLISGEKTSQKPKEAWIVTKHDSRPSCRLSLQISIAAFTTRHGPRDERSDNSTTTPKGEEWHPDSD